jgi:hypothetical protein
MSLAGSLAWKLNSAFSLVEDVFLWSAGLGATRHCPWNAELNFGAGAIHPCPYAFSFPLFVNFVRFCKISRLARCPPSPFSALNRAAKSETVSPVR